jgi:HEAT repeat protein
MINNPEPVLLDALVARCAAEPDFYVRDMLTWALTRLPPAITVTKLVAALSSEGTQARSQALHTLSKIRDSRAWPAITRALLRDTDDSVAAAATCSSA